MYCTGSLTAQEDGSIALTDADDICIVDPITVTKQTAGGYHIHEPDHETAALLAAAPDLFFALQETLAALAVLSPETHAGRLGDKIRSALRRAETPEFSE